MRYTTSKNSCMNLIIKQNIVYILTLTAQQTRIFEPGDSLPNAKFHLQTP